MKFSYYYWAGPWKTTGPRPHSACVDRANGRAAAWLGASAQASLAQLGRGEGATPLRLGPAAPRVSDPRAGEELRRPVLTGGEPFWWRGRC